jgi:hypothetical protein
LARKAIYQHATQVNLGTHPDDGTSPVGSAEWNEAPDAQGMFGNTPATSTIAIASGVAIPTDSVTVVTSESSTTDILDKLATTNTNEYDLIYLFANTGHTITLTHTASPSAAGHIFTVSGANETLSVLKPTILMRKGTYWYGYGGGGSTTPTDITVADESSDTTCFPLFVTAATGDLAPKSGSNLAFNSNTGILTATGFAGALTGNVTGDASGSSGTCSGLAATATALATARTIGGTSFDGTGNIAITTNANLTGEVTSSGNASTIAGNIVDEANLKVSNAPTNGYMLTAQSGNTGGLTWAASGGGNHTEQGFDVYTTHTGTGTTADGIAYMFSRRIDANNDGLYIMLWKNGASTEVQIA